MAGESEVVEIADDAVVATEEGGNTLLSSNQNQIQVTIKKDVWTKPFMLCELHDEHISFDGDSGAIGRLTVGKDKLEIDLKGRQFSGNLVGGPLIMMLNIAPPVGQAKSAVVGRVEAVTSEYCRLDFQRDMMSDLQGIYSGHIRLTIGTIDNACVNEFLYIGDVDSAGLFDDEDGKGGSIGKSKQLQQLGSKRARKSAGSSGAADGADEESEEYDSDVSTKPLEKKPSIRDNPTISTITNRQRSSKKSSGKKTSSNKKKKVVKKK